MNADSYGNVYSLPVTTVGNGVLSGYSLSGSVTWPPPGTAGTYFYPPVTPSLDLLRYPGVLDTIIERLATTVKPGDKAVVCVDTDMNSEEVREIQQGLQQARVPAMIIRGARAGTGFPTRWSVDPTSEEKRVDFLARMGEIWGLRPDLKFTDLLSWYCGNDMDDADFVAAFETHFLKVTNGVHGRPQ